MYHLRVLWILFVSFVDSKTLLTDLQNVLFFDLVGYQLVHVGSSNDSGSR